MKYLKLPETDLTVSCMGFGSSHLMGRIGRSESVRLLQTAFDAGITHFDTARMYGYGAAESAVGKFLKGKRSQVTVATKVGIAPPEQSSLTRVLKPVLRRAVTLLPRLRSSVSRRAQGGVQGVCFDIPFVRSSFETSLRELRTDYVDMLLLHECDVADLRPELLAFLEQVKREGKTRYFGLATSFDVCVDVISSAPAYCNILQFPSSIWSDNASRLRVPAAVITHSVLRENITQFRRHLETEPDLARKWSAALELDCLQPGMIPSLALRYALGMNQNGIVLFSSTSPSNIRLSAGMPHLGSIDLTRLRRLMLSLDEDAGRLAAVSSSVRVKR